MTDLPSFSSSPASGGENRRAPTPELIYNDDSIAVAIKPSGIASQKGGSTGKGGDMIASLSLIFGGDIYPVHRLDRETAGIMVYARTQKAAATLSASFAGGGVVKKYLAVVLGEPSPASGEYRDLLYHDARRNKSYVVSCMRRGVREAVLRYRTVGTSNGASLVAVRLLTGRTHQIRVQFASRGTPVLGDRRYGGKPDEARWGTKTPSARGIALYCASLAFPHPDTKETMRFEQLPKACPFDEFEPSAAAEALRLTE